ncbi:uncharacterized protein LY89DRAFT_785260 [Mollisia scopiformis]|uniref:Uncharacterized protein n=1 Tax=Mollisia scopiformis TaxID=149040 RepID=A0A194X0W8_MOLSC|nr:uncharacterized protein LY89DRAFT_785260 [Mollisia scopiformis]KUJ13609.1 hypothetical protein LY89DRAFT_785260 [Mollisia scopiformis]
MLLEEPADFLQQLASQNQLLACLQWLGEFQVLACIPLNGSVPIRDIADLSGVPEAQLRRVVRMTATSGFLNESQPGYVAHTPLSAPFVTKPLFLDAGMFLAKSSGPAALQMASATQRFGNSSRPHESAYNLAFNTSETFESLCEQRSKVQRQWSAYLRYSGETDDVVSDFLTQLDWSSLGNACVVNVGAQSSKTAMGLAERYPALQFIVQMSEPAHSNGSGSRQKNSSNRAPSLPASSRGLKRGPMSPNDARYSDLSSRITIQKRTLGTPQTVNDAAVYILSLPSPSPSLPSHSVIERFASDLRAHLGVLHGNSAATLILTMCPLPKPNTVDPDIEASARQRDLTFFQLANDHRLEVNDVEDVINNARDTMGALVIVNRLRSWKDATMAFGVKYQTYGSHQHKPKASLSIL